MRRRDSNPNIFLVYVLLTSFLLVLIGILYLYSEVQSQEHYVLYAEVLRVIDGDTFEVYVLNSSKVERLRLKCIDFPDLSPSKRVEKWFKVYHIRDKALLEKCYHEGISLLKDMLENRTIIVLQDKMYERDKYSRLLGYVIFNGVDINEFLIENGYAIPYLCDKYTPFFDRVGCLWN